jgi:ABC-type transporter Mla subunit MlaD
MVEYYVQNITRRYYFFAELFLLTGLAGAALTIQNIFGNSQFDFSDIIKMGSTTVAPEMLEVRKGIAFSAAGIVLAIVCYILRAVLLLRYQAALEEGFKEKAKNESTHADELRMLRDLLERFLDKQTDSIIPLDKVLTQIEALNETLNSNVIQKQFTGELGTILDRLEVQTKERLSSIEGTVRSAIELVQESRNNLDRQFEHSRDFLIRLDDLQTRLNQSGNEIANRMEQISRDIRGTHEPFLDSVRAIHLNLTNTTDQITDDLKTAHKTLRENFGEEVRKAVQIHKDYVQDNQEAIQSALDKAVVQLTSSMKNAITNALDVLSKGIEKTNQQLYKDISEEHANYTRKIEKYQDLLGYFTQKLGPLLDRLETQTEKHLASVADTVYSVVDLIQESRNYLDKQSEYAQYFQYFLKKLEELQDGLDRSGNNITTRMEQISKDIQSSHQPFLEDVKTIRLNLTKLARLTKLLMI